MTARTTQPVQIVQAYIARVWNGRDLAAMDELLRQDYRRHLGPRVPPLDRDGQRARIAAFHRGFSDLRMEVRDLFAAGARVTFRFDLLGTHDGEFRGVAASGQSVAVEGIDIATVEGGEMVEHWGVFDRTSLFAQMRGD